MKKLYIFVIIFQISIIIFLYFYIIKSRKQILGQSNVNLIKKDSVQFPEDSNLKYYFERQPNTTYTEPTMPWLLHPVSYRFNNDGLNNINDYQVEKPDTTFRIIALGDSFTQGMFVATEKNWVTLSENQLNKLTICPRINQIEVLNLGVAGHDIQYAVETFKRKGIKYNPDLVIWFLKEDDFTDINELMRKNQEKYSMELKASGKYDELIKKGDPYPYFSMLMEDMKKIRDTLGEDYIFSSQKEFMNRFMLMYTDKLLFITMSFGGDRYRDYLKDVTWKRENTYYFELTSTAGSKEYSFYPNDVHPNEKGHQRITQELSDYLLENNFMICE